jgi:hypothetical protein
VQLNFRPLADNEMDRPPTQRDQFNNEDVDLVDALVRESIQNSLDAGRNGETVRVRFALHQPDQDGCSYITQQLDLPQLALRLKACEVATESVDLAKPRLLVIEDFGTTGLEGSSTTNDKGPFADFWRRMGRSHKAGKSLGRWGLGKLVFSSASQARSFFGVTVRASDPDVALLMGQAVLTTHELAGQRFDSHGFFCEVAATGMQLPTSNSAEIATFKAAAGITRSIEPGLSIAIPYIVDTVTDQRLLQATLKNYFFPILLGRLTVTVGQETLDADSFEDLAQKHGGQRFETGRLAKFIASMRAVRKGEVTPHLLPANWPTTGFSVALGEDVKALRDRYQAGECLCLRAPLLLKQKDGTELSTRFDLFLQRAADESEALFVRDTIVLPAETKHFRGHQVLAALVADDKSICSFLGDAENPAHTSWSARAEKVTTEWRNSAARLREIRGSLQQLYNEIVSSIEASDPNALIDFFSANADAGSTGSRPKGPIVRPPKPPTQPQPEKAYRLVRMKGGFSVRGGKGLTPEQLPLVIRVKAAYDVLRGNPFSRHDPLDFDFFKGELQVDAKEATAVANGPNVLLIKASGRDFEVAVSGFDVRRDLIIDASRP